MREKKRSMYNPTNDDVFLFDSKAAAKQTYSGGERIQDTAWGTWRTQTKIFAIGVRAKEFYTNAK